MQQPATAKPPEMSLGQMLLTYGLIPVLILTVYGVQRARRARAGWIAWLPLLLYAGAVLAAFILGATGASGLVVLVYVLGIAAAISGPWLFFKFAPDEKQAN